MIEAFCGYPGTGKTFALTYRAYCDIKKGHKVFTNYPVKGAYRITFDDLVNYTFPQYSTVIIDESGRWFNSRKWKDLPSEVFDLFTLHRHMKLDLLIAVQNFNRIDVSLREVIELVWWARNYPLFPFFIYDGYYDFDKLGMTKETNKRMFVSKFSRSRKFYDTHVMSSAIKKDQIPMIPWSEEYKKPNIADRIRSLFRRGRLPAIPEGVPPHAGEEVVQESEMPDWDEEISGGEQNKQNHLQ